MIKEERIISLDIIRVVAIFLVVLNHAAEMIYPMHQLSDMTSLSLPSQVIGFAAFTLGRLGVPLFLFLSGYLLLSRGSHFQDEKNIVSFYKKNLLPLLLTWEIWILLYNIFNAVMHVSAFQLKHYLAQAFFLESVSMMNSWYMPMILGMYLFIPFVGLVLSKMRGRWIALLLLICYIYCFFAQNLGIWFQDIGSKLDLSFGGGAYGVYLVIGYCFWRYETKIADIWKRKTVIWTSVVLAILLYLLTVVFQILMFSKGNEYRVWYNFFTLPLISAVIFLILKKIQTAKGLKRLIVLISNCAFGVFLVHVPLMMISVRYINTSHLPLTVLLNLLIVFAVSVALVAVLCMIPGNFGRVVFLYRRPKPQK